MSGINLPGSRDLFIVLTLSFIGAAIVLGSFTEISTIVLGIGYFVSVICLGIGLFFGDRAHEREMERENRGSVTTMKKEEE